jgi:flagellar motor switch protein FliG
VLVFDEAQSIIDNGTHLDCGGIDVVRELLEDSFGSQKAIDVINRLTSSLQVRPFDWVRRCDPAHLLNLIAKEPNQIIALTLSYLEPNKASVILENLPTAIIPDVAHRIATMGRVSPEILREIERVLEKKLSSLSSEDYTSAGGVESLVEILNLCDMQAEKLVIEGISKVDAELAAEVKRRMFVFEDIVMLMDRDIATVAKTCNIEDLALSLFCVDSEVCDKVFRSVGPEITARLDTLATELDVQRLKVVEQAQERVCAVIRDLEEKGEITVIRCGEDELVVYSKGDVNE